MLVNGCIIGGGIAGLSTAIALQKLGIDLPVYEGSSGYKPVGGGIILSINAIKVLKHLDVLPQILEEGVQLSKMVITSRMLEPISLNLIPELTGKFRLPVMAIRRPALQKILLSKFEGSVISDKVLSTIHKPGAELSIEFEDGSRADHGYAICADGIRSRARKQLFPEKHLRDHNQICWRGIVSMELSDQFRGGLFEAWGNGVRFGFTEVGRGEVYWYALANKNMVFNNNSGLLEHFVDFHPLVCELIERTDISAIYFDEIHDCPPLDKWYHGEICLIGDAAHATTPNLGQGAAQALEDAYCLSRLIFEKGDYGPEKVFALFQQKRKGRADFVVEKSRTMGKMAHLESALLCGVRNFAMKNTPRFIAKSQMEKLFSS